MNKLINVPVGTNTIEIRKEMNKMISKAKTKAKPDKCILCGRTITSCCNSHSVPQFSLKSIAENGKILQANVLIGIEPVDIELGVNNSGTFHFICKECDNSFFKEYECLDSLENEPTDKMLAEIAVKNFLLQLSKRYVEIELAKLTQRKRHFYVNIEDLLGIKEIDIKEYSDELFMHKNIADNNQMGCYQLMFWHILPYKVPLAMQSAVVLRKDMEGNEINDNYNLSKDVRMQYLHIAVLPFKEKTAIMVFYHRRDKLYRKLWHQFNASSLEKCLSFINYIIFAYTENYFIAPSICTELEENDKLCQLSQEVDEMPQMGLLGINNNYGINYHPVSEDDIPNFLICRSF